MFEAIVHYRFIRKIYRNLLQAIKQESVTPIGFVKHNVRRIYQQIRKALDLWQKIDKAFIQSGAGNRSKAFQVLSRLSGQRRVFRSRMTEVRFLLVNDYTISVDLMISAEKLAMFET